MLRKTGKRFRTSIRCEVREYRREKERDRQREREREMATGSQVSVRAAMTSDVCANCVVNFPRSVGLYALTNDRRMRADSGERQGAGGV